MSLNVTIESASANIHRSTAPDNVLFCISVPNQLLYHWYASKKASGSATTIVSQFNKKFKGITLTESLEVNLNMKGARLTANVKQKGNRKKILNKSTLIDVHGNDVLNHEESLQLLRYLCSAVCVF